MIEIDWKDVPIPEEIHSPTIGADNDSRHAAYRGDDA